MPNGWVETTLGEIIDIKHGFAFKGEFISLESNDKILVTPGNFKIGGGFKSDKYKYYAMKSIVGVHVDYGGKKFRKTLVKNSDELITKISTYVNAVMEDVVKYTGGYPYKRGL